MDQTSLVGSDAAQRIARRAGPLLVFGAAVAMLAWTWSYCPDPVVDFGREAYLPWQITEGRVLYRDLSHLNGPVSVYFNALVLETLGVSLRSLKLVNATIIVLLALLIERLVREMSDRIAAALAGVTFAVVFACGQLTENASFNFLTPYSHELTHGLALSLVMIACLWRFAVTRRSGWLVGAGFCLGVVSLTKAEILFAAAIAALGTTVAVAFLHHMNRGQTLRLWAILLAAAVIPPITAIVLLWLVMPLPDAMLGALGAWRWAVDARLMRISYFRWLMGTDDPARNLANMFVWAGWYGTIALSGLALAWVMRGRSRGAIVAAAVALAVVIGLVLGCSAVRLPWAQIARPLPLFLAVILAGIVLRMLRHAPGNERLVLPLAFALLSAALLVRMLLRVNIHHYGFALAMPGMMLLLAALVGWVPHLVGPDRAWIPRAAVLAASVVTIGMMMYTTGQWIARRTHPVGHGKDCFYADVRGRVIDEALRHVARDPSLHSTLTPLPQGGMLNFLSRRGNPARYPNYLPAEMMLFDEDRMLADLEAHPPDWIVLVHADTTIYDAPYFGRDYGRRIADWIRQNYHAGEPIGARPFTSQEFGILLMKRRTPG